MENSRIQSDTTGWKGDVGTSFSFSKNVQEVLNISATMHFTISTNWNYSYDTRPPVGTPNVTYTITNGFAYTF